MNLKTWLCTDGGRIEIMLQLCTDLVNHFASTFLENFVVAPVILGRIIFQYIINFAVRVCSW